MRSALQLLEDLTTHQDYLWFLALLAWIAVVAGAWRRPVARAAESAPWLVGLGLSAIAGAALELALLVQDIRAPYTKFDAAMGLAQAVGGAMLWWARWGHLPRGGTRWGAAIAITVATLAVSAARIAWPLAGGTAWAFFIAAGGLIALRTPAVGRSLADPRDVRWLRAGLGGMVILSVLAVHGPLATLAGEPRIIRDFSHFALVAAGLLLLSGACCAIALWRGRLAGELGRSTVLLAGWLAAGLAFAVWSGREARLAFEENLLRRATTAAALLDPAAVRAALGPELRVESLQLRLYEVGRPVEMATLPYARTPPFAILRAILHQLHAANPDLRDVHILVARSGKLVHAVSSDDTLDTADWQMTDGPTTPDDMARLERGESFLKGPFVRIHGGSTFTARAAVGPAKAGGGPALGWLVLEVSATRWTKNFIRARLQAMALVGAGAILWSLALAYRLRRDETAAAQRQAADARKADEIKSAFLAKVSHELRTPIQSVLGYGEMLERAPLRGDERDWLRALRTHGEVMLRLVNDLLDLGALQAGVFQLRPAPASLPTLAAECVNALTPRAAAKGLGLSLTVAPEAPPWVEVDAVRLRQILLNLISNAVKYTPRGRVDVTVTRTDHALRFTVADTGPGIPPQERDDLFRPFVRLTTAGSAEGSGVGLALVSGLCTAMGGHVRYDPSGPGAIFVAELPLREVPAPAPVATPSASTAFAGLRVLLAEDNTLVRELLVAFLRTNGAEVEAVADGVEAVAACQRSSPQAVVLDIAMPRMDGLEAARAIRATTNASGARPRLIGLSAHAQPEDEERARAAGMDCFLTKPVGLGLLAAALAPALAPQTTAQPTPAVVEIADPMERLMGKLREQYRIETPGIVLELHEAFAARDWPHLRQRAHYLKNSADVLGLDALQRSCQELFAWCSQPTDPTHGAELVAAVERAAGYPLFSTPTSR
jgi:signal transduction histidine kinase/CheY-like chemotaxis protein/HPt (histidine-containing phosphotransfer) domain-containing protein